MRFDSKAIAKRKQSQCATWGAARADLILLERAAPRRKNGTTRRARACRKYIGGARHGSLSQKIDEELYGGPVR